MPAYFLHRVPTGQHSFASTMTAISQGYISFAKLYISMAHVSQYKLTMPALPHKPTGLAYSPCPLPTSLPKKAVKYHAPWQKKRYMKLWKNMGKRQNARRPQGSMPWKSMPATPISWANSFPRWQTNGQMNLAARQKTARGSQSWWSRKCVNRLALSSPFLSASAQTNLSKAGIPWKTLWNTCSILKKRWMYLTFLPA